MKEINAEFGYWFAGFTESQGLLSIERRNNDKKCVSYDCPFRIVRDPDDIAVLELIRDTLGIGLVKIVDSDTTPLFKGKEMSMFQIVDIDECAELVKVFEKYPLRFRKRHYFAAWKQTVTEMQKPEDCRDFCVFNDCYRQLEPLDDADEATVTTPRLKSLQLSIEFEGADDISACADLSKL